MRRKPGKSLKIMSENIDEAVRLLCEYHRQLSLKVAAEIAEKKDQLDAFAFGTGISSIENAAHELNLVNTLIHNLKNYGTGGGPPEYKVSTLSGKKEKIGPRLVKWVRENATIPRMVIPIDRGEEITLLLVHSSQAPEEQEP